MNFPSVCVAVKVFISLSLLKCNSLDVGGHLEASGRTTWPWGCAVEWPLWVAVSLGLGGIGLGPWGFPPNPCSVEKRIETEDRVYLHKMCVCSGVWKGKKEMGIFKPPKGTLKVCRIGS